MLVMAWILLVLSGVLFFWGLSIKKWSLAVGGAITIVGGVGACIVGKLSPLYVPALRVAVVGILVSLAMILLNAEGIRVRPKILKESLKYMTFDAKKKEISIIKRGNMLRSVIRIQEVTEREKEYAPEKLHLGAVTVGGVTTGGIYKTGGVYDGKAIETGKYALVYNGIRIEKIKLPPELKKMAEESDIKQYLDGSGAIEVVGDIQMDVSDMRALQALEHTHPGAYAIYLQKLSWTRYPTREKCKEILDWLCQE